MLSDYKINKAAKLLPIYEIAKKIGLSDKDLDLYGDHKAKIKLSTVDKLQKRGKKGKLILVTAITPTKFGEGKSTVTIGLGDALRLIGKDAMIALREPSLGPCFGIKGGATGGGYTQVAPMEDINLHFTGDLHAITTANNLLASMIDNHIYHGNELRLDETKIRFKRCVDLNDRALRSVEVGMDDKKYTPRHDGFDITVASEIMAIFCLSRNMDELGKKLSNIIIGQNKNGQAVYARDIKAVGAMKALLKDALAPNLVQTLAHTPALIHGGPFANIAHGCNSIIATEAALALSDYVVTEAGFAADLGAEKFLDIKCRTFGLTPAAVVLVATTQAMKLNGAENLKVHIENLKKYGVNVVVAINHFAGDSDAEIAEIAEIATSHGVPYAVSYGFSQGGEGVRELAREVEKACEKPTNFAPIYDVNLPAREKIEILAKEIYRAAKVEFSEAAEKRLTEISKTETDKYVVCMAKTQNSITDDTNIKGDPTCAHYTFHVRDIRISNGAKFIVAISGTIMTMPGLPKVPTAEIFDTDAEGNLTAGFDKADR